MVDSRKLYCENKLYSSEYVGKDECSTFYCANRDKIKCKGSVKFSQNEETVTINDHVEGCQNTPYEQVELLALKVGYFYFLNYLILGCFF